jgi:hypothetical protein
MVRFSVTFDEKYLKKVIVKDAFSKTVNVLHAKFSKLCKFLFKRNIISEVSNAYNIMYLGLQEKNVQIFSKKVYFVHF